MFKIDEDNDLSFLSSEVMVAEKNYVIQPNDLIEIRVYTNKGEQIIDPNYELQQVQSQNRREQERPRLLVLEDGTVKFPMIGVVSMGGMQITEAETHLEKKYNEYYKDAFVKLTYLNKRVIVLGAPGGKVIPLENENTSIVEVVALAGGIDVNGKAHNLRLIRGDLHEPQVFLIDLSTVAGMRTSMMNALPGDIIYIEPTRKILTEGARDFMTIFAIVVNAITLYYLIVNINN
jgi:polysaccharide export outer membrane protein